MSDWLARYEAGQHEQTWTDMLALGHLVRANPEWWVEAKEIASVTMRRVRANLELLAEGLPRLGYEFANPGAVLVPPSADVAAEFDRLEASVGLVPLAFRTFAETLGSVDFSGEHPDWDVELLDPLMVDLSVPYALETRADMIEQGELGPDDPFDLDFAPDDLHKADISGGGPVAIRVPNRDVDGLVLSDVHQTTFTHYLRLVLRAGGMGGLTGARRHGREPSACPPELQRLAAELQPF